MSRINCWEYKKCGRNPGGANTMRLGICPASYDVAADGVNDGRNGGRVCWSVAGNINNDSPQRRPSGKPRNCLFCDFFMRVCNEEGMRLQMSPPAARKVLSCIPDTMDPVPE